MEDETTYLWAEFNISLFDRNSPWIWFRQLETLQQIMFAYVIDPLSEEIVNEMDTTLENMQPTNPYDKWKPIGKSNDSQIADNFTNV